MKNIVKVIVIFLIIIEGIFIHLAYKSFKDKPNEISEIKINSNNEISLNNSFAIMLENTSGGFTASSDRSQWPSSSAYIYFGSTCYDGEGNEVMNGFTFDANNSTATISTDQTLYCSINFALKTSILGKLLQSPNGQFETEINMKERCDESEKYCDTLRRFQGDQAVVRNNYICFGTSDLNTCVNDTDKYMYRIIGVVTKKDTSKNENIGQLKIIKKEALNSGIAWNGTETPSDYWNNCNLRSKINGTSFLTNITSYPYMQQNTTTESNWTKLIVNHIWQYGDLKYDNESGIKVNVTNAFQVFKNENTVWKTGENRGTVTNKIGLMFPSDYMLALSNTSNCINGGANCKNNWIYLWKRDVTGEEVNDLNPSYSSYGVERTMVRVGWKSSSGGSSSWTIESYYGGLLGSGYYSFYSYDFDVRPVFYLSEKIKIKEGTTGTIDNPYIITNAV